MQWTVKITCICGVGSDGSATAAILNRLVFDVQRLRIIKQVKCESRSRNEGSARQ